MRLCNETITVICSSLDEETGYDVYTPVVISGCSWFAQVVTSVDAQSKLGGLKAATKVSIRIPEEAEVEDDREYVRPENYTDPATQWTLKVGDIVVRGAVRSTSLSDIRAHTEHCTILGSVDNRRAPHAPHWRVTGS